MTNNVASVSVKTGAVAPPGMELNQCAELGKANQEARDKVVSELETQKASTGLNQADQAALDKAKGTGMTFSSASSKLPNAGGSFTGCSNAAAQQRAPDIIVEGGTSEQKGGLSKLIRESCDDEHGESKEVAGVLCDKSHVHPGGGAGAHAEPKIVNHLTNLVGPDAMKGGSLLFNIDWRSSKYGPSGMPCQHCFKMLCHAAQKCDIRIFICSHDNKPIELSKDDCDGPDAYEDLCMGVDGQGSPGRKLLSKK